MRINSGSTDRSVYVHLSSATDGSDMTALAHADVTLAYIRDNNTPAPVAVTPVAQSISGTHADGGFCHVSGGEYRIDLPDAAFAAGAHVVRVYVSATDTVQTGGPLLVELDSSNAAIATELAKVPKKGDTTRWTNAGSGSGYDDITLGDVP